MNRRPEASGRRATISAAIAGHEHLVADLCGTTDGGAVLALVARWCRRDLGADLDAVPWAATVQGWWSAAIWPAAEVWR